MICSVCGSDRWDRKVHYTPFASARLEWTICRQCGSGHADGVTTAGQFITLVRDTSIGEDAVTLNGRTQRRRIPQGVASTREP